MFRQLSALGGFPIQPRRSTPIRAAPIVGGNSYDILDIPQNFDALMLFYQASCDTATRATRLRWSTDNATFFTSGTVGYYRDGASTSTQITSGDLLTHITLAAAATFTASILLRNYTDPNLPLMVDGVGTVDFGSSWSIQSMDLFRYDPLKALRIIWNNTGVFDGVSNYVLTGINF